MLDQAENLRQLVRQVNTGKTNDNEEEELSIRKIDNKSKVITIASGKGGVGKSNLVINLAFALSSMGAKILIFDADIGMSNDHVLMNVKVKYNVFDLINKNLDIDDVKVKGPMGVDLISGGSALDKIYSMSEDERNIFMKKLSKLENYDFILIDTGAGINKDILSFISACDELIVVTTPEPTSITDAYSLVKTVNYFKMKSKVNIVINKSLYKEEGISTFNRFKLVADKYLNLKLEFLGYILDDRKLTESVREQKPVFIKYPNSSSSKNIKDISKRLYYFEEKDEKHGLQRFFKNMFSLFS